MICRYDHMLRHPGLFFQMTGLRLHEFSDLLRDLLPRFKLAERRRLSRADRQRALGGGRHADLPAHDQILLTLIWLRLHPTNDVLGLLFGVSDSTVSRVRARVLPLLDATGHGLMRWPDPGRKRRKTREMLLAELPELATILGLGERYGAPAERFSGAEAAARLSQFAPLHASQTQ